jgi:hypothetical protein
LPFNFLKALNLNSWKWTEVETRGEVPEPRSGHQTTYIPGKLVVMGGWNNIRQFDDCYILDLNNSSWSRSDTASGLENWGPPRWNHTSVSVFSVPNWKAFIFGGNSGDLIESGNPQGTYLNDVSDQISIFCHFGVASGKLFVSIHHIFKHRRFVSSTADPTDGYAQKLLVKCHLHALIPKWSLTSLVARL